MNCQPRGVLELHEGDNLEVLQHLQADQTGTVHLVLIDPPYNTGRAFTYGDKRGQDWANMMRPRLQLARELLAEDGAIVIHIDEHEHARLSLLLAEVFGQDNCLGTLIWDKLNPKGDARGIACQHESILCWARDRATYLSAHPLRQDKPGAETMIQAAADAVSAGDGDLSATNANFRKWIRGQDDLSRGEAAYNRIDEQGRVFQPVSMAWPNKRTPPEDYFIPLLHPVTGKPCPVPARGWRNPPATMNRLLSEGRIVFGQDAQLQPRRKYYLDETRTQPIPSIVRDGSSDDALLASLGAPFDHPKPLSLTRRLVRWFTHAPGDRVLDFFAGSGTTGHAVLLENAEHGRGLQAILVQSAEPVVSGSAAAEAGFETVVQLTQARLRAAMVQLEVDPSELVISSHNRTP
jgi:adenine-specific DNA-methyltransferase